MPGCFSKKRMVHFKYNTYIHISKTQ